MSHHVLASAVALGAITLFIAGCPNFQKAPGAPFSETKPPPGKAVIYFYRPTQKIMSSYPFFMSLPESANNCFRLESGGYMPFVTDPGSITVAGAMVSYKKMTIDVKAGDEKYVEVDVVDDDAAPKEVSASEGRARIAEMKGIETCAPSDVKKK